MHSLKELVTAGYSIENAQIKSVALTMADHDCLTLEIGLQGSGWGCNYGGYGLGEGCLGAKEFIGSAKGLEAIMRIMNTIGVSELFDAKGKYVRVATKSRGETIKIIGNVVDDLWFDYEQFFKEK